MSSQEKRRMASREGSQRVGLGGTGEGRESTFVGRAGWRRGTGHRGHLGR